MVALSSSWFWNRLALQFPQVLLVPLPYHWCHSWCYPESASTFCAGTVLSFFPTGFRRDWLFSHVRFLLVPLPHQLSWFVFGFWASVKARFPSVPFPLLTCPFFPFPFPFPFSWESTANMVFVFSPSQVADSHLFAPVDSAVCFRRRGFRPQSFQRLLGGNKVFAHHHHS